MSDYTSAWILTNSKATRAEGIKALQHLHERHLDNWRPAQALVAAWQIDKQYATAIDYFQNQIGFNPNRHLTYLGLSLAYNVAERPADALAAAAMCLKLQPNEPACLAAWTTAAVRRSGQGTPLSSSEKLLPQLLNNPYACIARVNHLVHARDMSQHRSEQQSCYEVGRSHPDPKLRRFIHLEHYLIATGMVVSDSNLTNDVDSAITAARESGDLQILSLLLSVNGNIHLRNRDLAAAQAVAEEWDALSLQLGPLVRASAVFFLAQIQSALGEPDRAVLHWEESVRIQKEEGILSPSLLMYLAGGYRRAGRTAEALETIESSVQLGRTNREPVGVAFALRSLSVMQQETGDYWRALENGYESARLFRTVKMPWQAGAGEGNLPHIYESLGDFPKALHFARKSLLSARKYGDQSEVKRNLASIGGILSNMGRTQEALAVFDQALAVKQDVQGVFEAAALIGKANALRRLGRRSDARAALQQVLIHTNELSAKMERADVLHLLGQLDLDERSLTAAKENFEQSLELARPFKHHELALANLKALAEVHQRQGDNLRRWTILEQAIASLNATRSRIPTPELRQEFQGLNARVFEDAIDALVQLHRAQPAHGWDRKALELAEQGRARVLSDLMTENRFHIARALTPQENREKNRLEQRVSLAHAALMKDPTGKNTHALTAAEQLLSNWIEQIRLRNPEYANVRYPGAISAAEIQRLARRDSSAILVYSLGVRSPVLWVVTADTIRTVALPDVKDIEQHVRNLRGQIGTAPKTGRSFDAPARRLHTMLLSDALQMAPSKRLLIVPDGILYYLPFEALIGNDGKYLIENHSVTYAPSVSTFAALGGRTPAQKTLLAYGDPTLHTPDPESTATSHSVRVRSVLRASGLSLYSLPHSRIELQRIAQTYSRSQSTLRVGHEATESSIKQDDLTRYGTVHFATHAIIDESAPSRSGIVLNLIDNASEDGVLRATEVLNLRLRADLVVLSACQTGLGRFLRGEGMMGLTRSFLAAGADRVVVSLWPVNDAGTADLMAAFYANRARTASTSESLRQAKLEMIRSSRPAYRHPYFWAGFVEAGAW